MRKLITFFALFAMTASISAWAADGGSIDDFLMQVLEFVKSSGGLSMQMKIASIITILISLTKLSILRPLWDKLGNGKVLVAPVLGIISGIVMLPSVSVAGVCAFLLAGVGSIALHEILDVFKVTPQIKGTIDFILGMISKLLGGK
jgi:hypothetical protein